MFGDKQKCGVYAIRNLINGKVYIGSTTDSFRNRWNNHKKRLKKGTHYNKHLQSAYNKYGKDNLVFQIIEITQPENAVEREGYYIKFYNSLNPKYGYNQVEVNLSGKIKMSESTKKKLSEIAKNQWKCGVHKKEHFIGRKAWNKGIKCDNISIARRNMFSAVRIYKDNILIATFRSVTDLSEWTKTNELPGLTYYNDHLNRPNLGKRTTYLLSSNIHRAIRNKSIYRGLSFEKTLPLPQEIGVVQWENCWKGEIPNQQPNQPLTKLEGSETNS